MSRNRRLLLIIPLILFVLACQALMTPVNQAQDLARTAEAIATQAIEMETQAAPLAMNFANPTESLETQPAPPPDGTPGTGNIFDPQGTPLTSWKDIPVMPQAVAGEATTRRRRPAATTSTSPLRATTGARRRRPRHSTRRRRGR